MAAAEGTNPIRYIEDLYWAPLRRRRIAPPGAAQVYLSRNGRLYCPAGGLTHGEQLWRVPRRVYEIDMSPHPLELSYELTNGSTQVSVDVTAVWQVVDPVAVVQARVFDVPARARPRLLEVLQEEIAMVGQHSGPQLRRALDAAMFPDVRLAEGIALREIHATVPVLEEHAE